MRYYGIVTEIKKEHKSGVYGNKTISVDSLKDLVQGYKIDYTDLSMLVYPLFGVPNTIRKLMNSTTSELRCVNEIKVPKGKCLLINDDALDNNYDASSKVLYGLFDGFILKDKVFKEMMKSGGGSTLHIIERDQMSEELKHISPDGYFNEGIYVEHPKVKGTLIPLNGFSDLVKSLILEESIRAFEALGAKKITIIDVTKIDLNVGGKKGKVEASVNGAREKIELRSKEFGKGTFDPERAINNKYFIQDIPAVMSIVEGRKEGNQLSDSCTESISLNLGLSTKVLGLFSANADFKYSREWKFEVEFYDKNDFSVKEEPVVV